MASLPPKIQKANIQEDKDTKESIETPTSVIASSLNAPKHGTVIPNRVFVGGISSATTENDLVSLFSNYGSVTGAKIIADRAGVSKGYGFVTFATEDEAKCVQKDADNIILRERRLNIAPAIKKQGYGRVHSYDCSPNTPVPIPSPVYRQNGVAYTFHNGMAFFPQPAPQAIPSTHIEQAVYQQGPPPPFSSVPQGSHTPTYQYPYPQGPFIYQPHHQYPYHALSYEGCYDSQLMVHDGNLVVPQYYVAPPDITFYQPTPMHSQDSSPIQPQVIYPSPRAYDPAIVCTSELPIESSEAPVQVQEADTSAANTVTTTSATRSATNNEITTTTNTPPNENANAVTRGKETPVVSLLKVYNHNGKDHSHHNNNNNKFQGPSTYLQSHGLHHNNHLRRKPRQPEEGRRFHLNNNNNNPDAANRNLVPYHHQGHHQRGSTGRKGSTVEGIPSDTSSQSNPRHPFVPNYHAHYRLPPPNHLSPFYNHQPTTHRTRSFFHRPRYGGPGGGRGGRHHHQRLEGGKCSNVKEEAQQPLTPPITPKSESGRGSNQTIQQQTTPDDLVKSMQTVVI